MSIWPRLTTRYLKIANGLSVEWLTEQLEWVEGINNDGDAAFRLLTCIEMDILQDVALDQNAGMLNRLEIVIASIHSKLRPDRQDPPDDLIQTALESGCLFSVDSDTTTWPLDRLLEWANNN